MGDHNHKWPASGHVTEMEPTSPPTAANGSSKSHGVRGMPGFLVLTVLWICWLLIWPACQRYFSVGDRLLCATVGTCVLLFLMIPLRGWKLVCVLPLAVVGLFLTVCICRHPNYTLTDYLLGNSGKEEKSAFQILSEAGAQATFDEGHVASITFPDKATEEEWHSLRSLPRLKGVSFSTTDVTDVNLQHLKCLAQLESVDLSGTSVSDSGLVHLTGLTRLRFLNLSNTRVTNKGANELQRALPICTIER
jgi:hypothetical protein